MTPRLPHAIEGFFFVAGSPDYRQEEAREAYYKFLEYYGLEPLEAPPLMVAGHRAHTHHRSLSTLTRTLRGVGALRVWSR